MAARQAKLLPVAYYHVGSTLPAAIAANPRHPDAPISTTAVLHTWGSTLTHQPHLHCIMQAGDISLDGSRWGSCRLSCFLPMRVLSPLFQRLFLDMLVAVHKTGRTPRPRPVASII